MKRKIERATISLSVVLGFISIPHYIGNFAYSVNPEYFTGPMWINGFAVLCMMLAGVMLSIGLGFVIKLTAKWIMEEE